MSRSRRHTPIAGITTAASEKLDKRMANKALRKATARAIQTDAEVVPDIREVSNVYGFAKDGKRPFDPKKHPEMMRK